VFGHIHEAYGVHREQNILFINAACLGELELIQHEPVVIGKSEELIKLNLL
jgi:Icc-related predicted phosphoesterase